MTSITPIGEHIGAEITGVDLAGSVDADTAAALNAAFLDHLVLVFRDQRLTPPQMRDGLRIFGTPMRQHRERFNLEECPDVSVVTNRGGFGPADMWHTDHTNHERPPKATVLYAVELPSRGGATCFASMYAGLGALPDAERERLASLRSVNDMEDNPSYSATDRARHPGGVRHPMVRTHPETGRKALYFHATKSRRIEGMPDDEVAPYLASLLERAVQPPWTYRHRWRPGDLVMVDNRCAMHRVEADYPPDETRTLWRVLLAGDRPV